MTNDPIAARIAQWAHQVTWGDVPERVRERSALHVLDCIGLAFACGRDDFAIAAVKAVVAAHPGCMRFVQAPVSRNCSDPAAKLPTMP